MKKILMCLLVLSIIVGTTACTIKTSVDEKSNEVPTLTWYLPGDEQADMASVLDAANKIIEPAIGAKLSIQCISIGAFTERMNMNMASGTVFDMCFTGYVNLYYDAVSKGGLKELDELLELTPALKKSLPDYFWDGAKINGKIYAVPNQQIIAFQIVPFVFKDLAVKYGLDTSEIKKMEDLEPFLEKIKANEPNYIPWRIASGEFTIGKQYEEIKIGFGIDINDPELKVVYIDDTEDAQRGMEVKRRWFEKGYIRPDVASVRDDTLDYMSGRYAVFQTTYKPGAESEISSALGKEVIGITNVGSPYVRADSATRTMTGISRTSKYPEKSIKFIELVNTNKELYNLLSFGIEGKHYKLTQEHKVKIIDDGGYAPKSAFKFGNQFNAIVLDGADSNVWEKTKQLNESAAKSRLLGFVLDTNSITSELSQCESVRSEFSALTIGAKLPGKDYTEYKRRMKEAGKDKVISEIQRQINEFVKNK